MDSLAQALLSLTDEEFEHFLGDLWRARGWKADVTQRSRDDGVDIVATRNDHYPQKRLIQAKHIGKEAKLSKSTVQQYSYLHQKESVDEVLLVTTGRFTSGARHAAKIANVKLIDLDVLLSLVRDTAAGDKLREYGCNEEMMLARESDGPDHINKSDIEQDIRDEIHAYANSRDVYARLLATIGLEDCTLQNRLGVLLQLFRGNDPLHVLLLTQPTDGGPTLAQRAVDLNTHSTTVDCTRVDDRGLIGRYTSAGCVHHGLLTEYSGGVVRLKQLRQYDQAATVLLEPLEEGRITATTGGFHNSFDAKFSALATSRFKYEHIDKYEPIWHSIDINPRLFAAFDFVGTVHDSTGHEFRLPLQYTDAGRSVSPITHRRLRQHVSLASDLNPTLSSDIEHTISDLHERAEHYLDERESIPSGLSTRESLVRLAKASARIRLSDVVDSKDVWIAAVGVPDVVASEAAVEMAETVCFLDDSESRDEIDADTTEDQRERIKTTREIIAETEVQYDEGAPIEEVLQRAEQAGIERSKAEHEIEKLRRQGEVYEPQTDHLRTT